MEMTLEEIEKQFDGEYVLVENPVTNEQLEVLRGVVRHHSFKRAEVYEAAIRLKLKDSAFLFVGEMPDSVVMHL